MEFLNGYNKFIKSSKKDLEGVLPGLAKGQQPHTLFITCSDSRVIPETFLQAGPGEVFVIRNAGNFIPASGDSNHLADQATLEYAVTALQVKNIVVCGHSHCGAVHACLQGGTGGKLPLVDKYLESFSLSEKEPSAAIYENALKVVENIKSFPFVQEALSAGRLNICAALYVVETGGFEIYNPESKTFEQQGEL